MEQWGPPCVSEDTP